MPPVDEPPTSIERQPEQTNPQALKSNVMARPRTERAKKPLLLVFTILLVVVAALIAWTLGWHLPKVINFPVKT